MSFCFNRRKSEVGLKVLIHTDVLGDIIKNADTHLLNMADMRHKAQSQNVSFWVSANSFYEVASASDIERVEDGIHFVTKNFSIIPLRSSTFNNLTFRPGIDFATHILIAAAENHKIDLIISKKRLELNHPHLRILTPAGFLALLETGEFESSKNVPFLDLKAQQHQIYNEIDNRITDIITHTNFILGKHVEEFEEKFALAQESKYCLGVSSGTDALHVALMALDIGHGDTVAIPVNTFIATAEAVSLTGARPILVDCDGDYNIDVKKLEKLLSAMGNAARDRLKALIPVHLYGQPADMDKILELAAEYDFVVVEDCCQAHLAQWKNKKVGNFGAFGAFSFYPGKNLGAYGEAGALVTNDERLYQKAKIIRQHGEIERYHHQVRGHNYRMAAIQGAVLATKLNYLKDWTHKRRNHARQYNKLLAGLEGILKPSASDINYGVYHLYVIQFDDRDGLRNYLTKHGIGTGLHYPVPIHMQAAYSDLGYQQGDFPVAEAAAGRILSLPMYPELTNGQIGYVCQKIKEYLNFRPR